MSLCINSEELSEKYDIHCPESEEKWVASLLPCPLYHLPPKEPRAGSYCRRDRESMLESFASVPGDHHGVSTNVSATENAADIWSVVICCTHVIPRRVERGDTGG